MSRPAAALACILALAPAAALAAGQGQFTQRELSALAFHQHPGARLPLDAALVDEDGRAVRLGEFFGSRPVVLVLDYLRCRSLCGFVLADLDRAISRIPLAAGRDFEVVSVSIDPRDRPEDARLERAKLLRRDAGGGAGWHFLTGSEGQVRRIAEIVGFPYRYDADADQYAHPAGITVASPDGRIARYILGLAYPPLDLRLALTEAAKGAISTPATALLLLCYCYDPATGRYSAAIGTAMRLLGGATVLAIAAMILLLSRRRPAP
jgi:protein SCO1/2